MDRRRPLYYHKVFGSYCTLDEDFRICDITDDISELVDEPFIVSSGADFMNFHNILDLDFVRFILSCKNDEQRELVNRLEHCTALACGETVDIKSHLLELLKLANEREVQDVAHRYKTYYDSVARPILDNVKYFNEQRIPLEALAVQELDQKLVRKIGVDENGYYFPVSVSCFRAPTNRLNSALFSVYGQLKPYFRSSIGGVLIELDATAAEFRYLLFISGESEKYEFKAESFWEDLGSLLQVEFGPEKLKELIYMWMYGAGQQSILEKLQCSEEIYKEFVSRFRDNFPAAYRWMFHSPNTKYWSAGNNVMYDYYGREIGISDKYKKVNYFLQSSFSTAFQLFVHGLRAQIRNMRSRILFTVHDSMFVDLDLSEQKQFFEIVNKLNRVQQPKLLFRIHSASKTNG